MKQDDKSNEETVFVSDLEPPPKLLVEQKTRELSSAGPLQKLHEDLSEGTLELISCFLELFVPDEMGLVVIRLKLLQQSFKLRLVQILVDFGVKELLHFIEVSGVESGREEGLLYDRLCGLLWLSRLGGGCCRHGNVGREAWAWPWRAEFWEFGDGFQQRKFGCHFC